MEPGAGWKHLFCHGLRPVYYCFTTYLLPRSQFYYLFTTLVTVLLPLCYLGHGFTTFYYHVASYEQCFHSSWLRIYLSKISVFRQVGTVFIYSLRHSSGVPEPNTGKGWYSRRRALRWVVESRTGAQSMVVEFKNLTTQRLVVEFKNWAAERQWLWDSQTKS
jgi:hypothetical protein